MSTERSGQVRLISDPYFIKAGYVSRSRSEYQVYEFSDVCEILWQPDVYFEAARVAKKLGATRIIDIGCGNAEKLVALHPRFDITGIDYGLNIQACRERYRFGTWIEHNLDTPTSLPLPTDQCVEAVVVCSDVVEHLVHPEFLLYALQEVLRVARAVVMSTPERHLMYGFDQMGPPSNPHHIREWTMEEFAALLEAAGLRSGEVGLTRSNSESSAKHTILAVILPDGGAAGGLRVALAEKRAQMSSRTSRRWREAPRRLPRAILRRIRRRVRRSALLRSWLTRAFDVGTI